LAEDLLRLSLQRDDSAGIVLAYTSCGRTLMSVGRFASSRSHLEAVVARYDADSHRSLAHLAGYHAHLNSHALLGIVVSCLGFPDQGLAESSAAIADARALDHRQEWRFGGGISLLRSGSATYRATRATLMVPYHVTLLAKACEISGQIEEGLTLLDDALESVERTGERWFAAELNRHKGQLLLRQGHPEAAEELYRKALGIAREQEAKLWELRAAVSVARLRRDQGRHAEARNLLEPVCSWFTESFDTQDLKEAKALLNSL